MYELWNRICSGSYFPPPVKGMLLKALRKHCQTPQVLLYVERRLKAPMQALEGTLAERTRGTRQAGVVSPLRANLFLR